MIALIGEVLKWVALPGAMLGWYFARFKIGHSIGAHYTFEWNQTTAPGIRNVILTNLQDRSTPIFALYAIQRDVAVCIHTFDTPLVLKSFDSVKVEIPAVSEYLVEGRPFDLAAKFETTEIYYSTLHKIKRCKPAAPPVFNVNRVCRFRSIKEASVTRRTFAGKVYSPNVVLIILYYPRDGDTEIAFVDVDGHIHWHLYPNYLPESLMMDPKLAADYLMEETLAETLNVRRTEGWNRRFKPGTLFNKDTDGRPVYGDRPSRSEWRPSS